MSTKTIVLAAMVSMSSAQSIPPGFPDMTALCGPMQKMAQCVQPMFDLVMDDTCKVLSPYTQGMDGLNPATMMGDISAFCPANGGRRLLEADVNEAKRIVTLFGEHSRRLTEGAVGMMPVETPDFTADDLVGLCKDDSNCLPTLFNGMKGLIPCIRSTLGEFEQALAQMGLAELMGGMDLSTLFDQAMIAIEPQMNAAEDIFKQTCTQNARGEYCITKFEEFTMNSNAAADPILAGCNKVLDLGCCAGTAPKILEAAGQGIVATGTTEAVKSICGWEELPKPCVASGESTSVAKLKFKLAVLAKSKFDQLDEAARLALKAAIKRDIAAKIGSKLTSLDIGEVTGDESGVDITIEASPETGSTSSDLAAAFSGDIAFTETQKMLQDAAVITEDTKVEGSGIAAEQEDIVSPIDLVEDSGAATVSPALCFAAVAAALLVAH
jgi:hypothetical protein